MLMERIHSEGNRAHAEVGMGNGPWGMGLGSGIQVEALALDRSCQLCYSK